MEQRQKNSPTPSLSPQRIDKISDLCESLLKEKDLADISVEDLLSLHFHIQNKTSNLFTKSSYIYARELIILGEDIDRELLIRQNEAQSYHLPKYYVSPPPKGPRGEQIREYDKETLKLVERRQKHHMIICEEFENIWEYKMRPKYFKKSRKVTEIENQATFLSQNGHEDESRALFEHALELKEKEDQISLDIFLRDKANARAKLETKQALEIETFLNERLLQRGRMEIRCSPKSQQSPRCSPSNISHPFSPTQPSYQPLLISSPTTQNRPSNIPPLLSYANNAHKRQSLGSQSTKTSKKSVRKPKTTKHQPIRKSTPALPGYSDSYAQANKKLDELSEGSIILDADVEEYVGTPHEKSSQQSRQSKTYSQKAEHQNSYSDLSASDLSDYED